MFNKNNLKYILILAIGFFACSSIYLTESTILGEYSDVAFSNRVAVVYANFTMAFGILLFSMIYRKAKNIRQHYILCMLLTLISLITFFTTDNIILMSVCLCLSCFFGTSGFCLGYHFALITSNVENNYRGRVFGIGYAIGSISSYLVMNLPNRIFTSYLSIIIYAILILTNILLVIDQKELDVIKKETCTNSFKSYFKVLSIVIILMSFLSVISTDSISISVFDMEGLYQKSRIWYAIGLIISGIVCDKNKELFDIITLSSFIFYLISIVLLNQNISPGIIVSASYFFLGFFVIFRTITFMNLSSKNKSMLFICCYGPMYHILVESCLAIFNNILDYYLILVLLESLALGLLLFVYILFYSRNNRVSEDDSIKELSLKYKLSIQEEKVLYLLMQDLSNQEIADKLFVSINTIRNQVASIYKKTNMNKKELREKCYFRTN